MMKIKVEGGIMDGSWGGGRWVGGWLSVVIARLRSRSSESWRCEGLERMRRRRL